MAEAFIRKRRDKDRRPRVAPARAAPRIAQSQSHAPSPASSTLTGGGGHPSSNGASSSLKAEPDVKSEPNPHIQEIKIFSSGASRSGLRYNIMRLNTGKDVDPKDITSPILMNRKRPGPRAPPIFATDGAGQIIGKFVYDSEGKHVMDHEGKPIIERKTEVDMSLVGHAPGTEPPEKKRKMKKGTKEVFHQDIEIMRLRREEALPWVLESGNPKEKPSVPEHWVGRMQAPSIHPKVLLMNDGTGEGFEMIPLGRTYRFDPERPFKLLDPDAANKLFEHQAKHKIHDRWSLRPEGPNQFGGNGGEGSTSRVKVEREMEERAARMEGRIRQIKGLNVDRKPKEEKYDDDYRREGRLAERGLEGGVDEELDFDEAEGFQDDDDNNTFYRDVNEEEEAKELEERSKKEFRLANANVGDRPQIGPDDDEDDLFGDNELNDEGKKLRKIMKKRREENPTENDGFLDTDEDSDDSDTESVNSKATDREKEKEKEKDGDKRRNSPVPEGLSRPPSRGSGARTSSPSGRRAHVSNSKRPNTAPPGSGAALVAQRAATRGASPRPHGSGRASSPLSGRAASPENTGGRGTSPAVRASSPASRAASPAPPSGAQGSSPASVSGPSTRDASPAPSSSQPGKNKAKRKTTSESPVKETSRSGAGPSPSGKRKTSPTASAGVADATSTSNGDASRLPPKKKLKKKGSATPTPAPEDTTPFEGMLTKQEVLEWFKKPGNQSVESSQVIKAFRNRIRDSGVHMDANQKLFLGWLNAVADKNEGSVWTLKREYQ
ncbi:hypothetical protein IAR55_000802 [Kwoniella newhampshirensis]|uniref:Transcription initiation factor IIF subunit alpha n=1 Tax=Kwoniella newhampshirensis TaxID=1651941 RepID=A0AAW0Z4G7_9TREE